MSSSQNENNIFASTFVALILGLAYLGITSHFWPDLWPWTFTEFWEVRGGISEWFVFALPILIWGVAFNFALDVGRGFGLFKEKNKDNVIGRLLGARLTPGKVLTNGFLLSLWAGIMEEVIYRWLTVLNSVPTLIFLNWLFFGWAGFGLFEWLNVELFLPVANWTTFGYMSSILFNEGGWIAGAAVLGANASFRDAHKYQGFAGIVNSWFVGMFLFAVMFQYGVLAAMVIHFSHNMLIFIYVACKIALKPKG